MMAKMFYTMEETKAALGKNEEEIKQYSREGRLREFRDGPRLMFKADQVDSLKADLGVGGGSGVLDLGPSDSGGPIGLVDSRTGSATGISLMDTDASGRTGTGAGMQLQDESVLGLGGSVGGIPSPGRPGSSGSLTGTRAGSGINVLGDTGGADPMAQTAISGNVGEPLSMEAVGSGSGLLDLTRESDDTSLGAELLDEIAPGGTRRGTRAGTAVGGSASGTAAGSAAGGTGVAVPATRGGRAVVAPVYVEVADPLAPWLAGAALGASLFLILGGLSLTAAVMDAKPALLDSIHKMSFVILLAVGVVLSVVCAVLGGVIAKVAR